MASLVVLGLSLTACGPSSPAPTEPSPRALVELTIGVLVPLTGPEAASGIGALESVRRVIAVREPELREAGLKVEVRAADDRGQQSVGQQQATILADDPHLLGVIGSTTGGVDEGVQPILAGSDLLVMSLGGAEPALTRSVPGKAQAFANYLTLSAQRSDRPRVAASMLPRAATSVVLRGPRREDAAMATTFGLSRLASRSPKPVVRRTPELASGTQFDAVRKRALQDWLGEQKPGGVYVVADPATQWETILSVREVLPKVPIIADEDVLRPWPDDVERADQTARDGGVEWGPLLTTTTGATPGAAEVPWPLIQPTATPTDAADPESSAGDQAIEESRFSIAAHDAAQAMVDGLIKSWASAGAAAQNELATRAPQSESSASMLVLRRDLLAEVRGSRQVGLLGTYAFDGAGVASRRLVGVYRAADQTWFEEPAREVIGPCISGACAVRVR